MKSRSTKQIVALILIHILETEYILPLSTVPSTYEPSINEIASRCLSEPH